jgi:hypothetical protein
VLSHPQIEHVKETAKSLFLDSQLVQLTSEEATRRFPVSKEIVDFTISIIADGGVIFLSTWDDLTSLWRKVRERDEEGMAPWLLQTSITFQALAFPTHNDHDDWVEHLARCYGCYMTPMGHHDAASLEKNLAIDDDLSDRLPKKSEFRDLLKSNAWFLYLVTLQLSTHEIMSEIMNQNKHRLGDAARTNG